MTKYLVSNQWIDEDIWKVAERVNMADTTIPEQMKILENGHAK